MLDDTEAREAIHVLLLLKVMTGARAGALVLKGGVNLRLYFESPRYSEDLDLDGDPETKSQIVKLISDVLAGPWLLSRLRDLGLEGVDYSGNPAKNTDTTVRFKLAVVNKGGIRLPTKVEVSLRDRFPDDAILSEAPSDAVVRPYLNPAVDRLVIPHYPRDPAIRQKLTALALRRETQARDVFDLHVLARGDVRNANLSFLKATVATTELKEASDRALSVTYGQFQNQVVAFLPDDIGATLDEAAWIERQLFTVELIEAILRD